jgi:hypothetical protein
MRSSSREQFHLWLIRGEIDHQCLESECAQVRENGKLLRSNATVPDNKCPPTDNMGYKPFQMPLNINFDVIIRFATVPDGTIQGYVQRTHFGSMKI